jgi:hypothetical protein
MRSKEEAIANPMAGDRWDMHFEERRILAIGTQIKRPLILWTDGRFTMRDTRKGFRSWAANAEFLGGAE